MKFLAFIFLVFSICILSFRTSSAESVRAFINGNALYNACTNKNQLFQNTCDGYITGSVDTLSAARIISTSPYGNGAKICISMNVSLGEIVDSVEEFLRKNPQSRQYSAAEEIDVALQKYFPCR